MMFGWLYHALGLPGTGPWYAFWSGFGSDLAELALIGSVWKLVNCHEPRCWRVGTKVTAETGGHHFRRCATHHRVRHP